MFEENGSTVVLPYLKPRDVLKCLLTSFPWTLLGGLNPGPSAHQMLKSFWDMYRKEHGSHEVFKMETNGEINLNHCIPMMLHGDGGRTLKKQPLEVVSLFAALGLDSNERASLCSCDDPQKYSGENLGSPFAQRLNSKHSSYLTHFLLLAFPSKNFKTTPGLLTEMLRVISEDIAWVCRNGISLEDGSKYYIGMLGIKSDLEYHSKTGFLTRSYQNVGHRNSIPCCHECLAGDPLHPFEDFGMRASWRSTIHQVAPWNTPPPFAAIPFDNWQNGRGSKFFRRDPFHVFRLGIARNFVASSVLLLCFDGIFDTDGESNAVDNRLSRAWANFSLWMHAAGERVAGIRGFTKQKLHYVTGTSFPSIGCKGSDTIVLLRWLRWCAQMHVADYPQLPELTMIVTGCVCGLQFQGIHKHGIWLKYSCRKKLLRNAKGFHDTYAKLAFLCHQRSLTLFAMVPKAHTMAHISHELQFSAMNPALYDCSMSEDFIGRISRQSRRVGFRKSVENTLRAYKVKAKLTLQRFKRARNL